MNLCFYGELLPDKYSGVKLSRVLHKSQKKLPMINGKELEVMYLSAMMHKLCLETSVNLRRQQHCSYQEFSRSSLNSK